MHVYLPYLLEYKSHPSISHTLYFCGENFDFNFEWSISQDILCLNTSSSGQHTSSRSPCLLFKLKTDGIAHLLGHVVSSLDHNYNLFALWNIRSIIRTLQKAQGKPGLNVRLILREIRYIPYITCIEYKTDKKLT